MKKFVSVFMAIVMLVTPMSVFASGSAEHSIQIIVQDKDEFGATVKEISIINGYEYYYEVLSDSVISMMKNENGSISVYKKYFDISDKVFESTIEAPQTRNPISWDFAKDVAINVTPESSYTLESDYLETAEISTYGQVEIKLREELVKKVGSEYYNGFITSRVYQGVTATLRENLIIKIQQNFLQTIIKPIPLATLAATLFVSGSMLYSILSSASMQAGVISIGTFINHKNCKAEYGTVVWINNGAYTQEFKTVTYKGIDSDNGAVLTDAPPTTSYYTTQAIFEDHQGLITRAFEVYFG